MKLFSTFALLLLLTSSLHASSGGKITSDKGEREVVTNPVNVNICMPKAGENISLVLRTKKGEILLQQELIAKDSAIEVKIPVLPAGLYLLSAKGSPQTQTQKLAIR